MAEKRCGFSHEAHALKVAGSNPASVKGVAVVVHMRRAKGGKEEKKKY